MWAGDTFKNNVSEIIMCYYWNQLRSALVSFLHGQLFCVYSKWIFRQSLYAGIYNSWSTEWKIKKKSLGFCSLQKWWIAYLLQSNWQWYQLRERLGDCLSLASHFQGACTNVASRDAPIPLLQWWYRYWVLKYPYFSCCLRNTVSVWQNSESLFSFVARCSKSLVLE